ncbi:MAG: pyruvate, water dikinase [Candidatus Babeliales bacterium]
MKKSYILCIVVIAAIRTGFCFGHQQDLDRLGNLNMHYVKPFQELGIDDVPLVGGKNASLGQMIQGLTKEGLRIPDGFAITAQGYWHFIKHNNLIEKLKKVAQQLQDPSDLTMLQKVGHEMRALVESGTLPEDLRTEIVSAYQALSQEYGTQNCDVAVRSSATAEDLPEASFAGQQETYLNVHGQDDLLKSVIKCFASLFTDRAIVYRMEKGFDQFEVGLSVGVQKMIRSDLACSGVMFTLDTETGFKDMIMINGAYGLGEAIVQGIVNPDEYRVYKPTLKQGFSPIVKKSVGSKTIKMVYAEKGASLIQKIDVPDEEQVLFCLNNQEILELARAGLIIEQYYSDRNGRWTPMDIEWAKDGKDGKLYILQARPETVHAADQDNVVHQYKFIDVKEDQLKQQLIVTGQSVGQEIASGKARVVESIHDIARFNKGDVLVTDMTDPDWVPVMKKASAIVTNRGGRTCHAAIVSRELGISAVIGADGATDTIKDGQEITIDCSKGETGYVYNGLIPFEVETIKLDALPELPVKLMVNCADPDRALTLSFLPVSGVGLARLEFVISNWIKMHPMVAIKPDVLKGAEEQAAIKELTAAYNGDIKKFFVDSLAQGIASIAAAFYPRPIIVRFSDFKSNEYFNLLGGKYFEPDEENPMIGFRGASRYYSPHYQPAFELECQAMKKVRDDMGLTNVWAMIPFVRTVTEGQKVLEVMKNQGLEKGKNGLKVIMMCEIPSNVILADEFLKTFDGFSIGSNDLTQMTLAVDRDSALLAPLFDERDAAVKKMLELAVEACNRHDKYSGICGQAPSDHPEIAQFLIDKGIGSLSLNADTVMPFIVRFSKRGKN